MDTFSFVRDIQDVPMYGKFLVSFDVESLFTNISLEECIDLAVKYILEGNPDIKLSDTELRDLFSVATAQTHFYLMVPSMTRSMVWPWAPPLPLSSQISLWDTMKSHG